jgi:hypothetical protein
MLGSLSNIEEQAVQELKKNLSESLGYKLNEVILYGSKARGDYNEFSDIDVLVIVNNLDASTSDMINSIAYEIELKYELNISTHDYSREYFDKQIDNSINLFMKNIINEGIFV